MLSFKSSSSFGLRFLPKLTVVTAGGKKVPVEFEDGQTLYQAVEGTPAQEIQGRCGGNMACGECHVIVPKKVFEAPEEDEKELISERDDHCETSRLACQLNLTSKFDGVEIKGGKK